MGAREGRTWPAPATQAHVRRIGTGLRPVECPLPQVINRSTRAGQGVSRAHPAQALAAAPRPHPAHRRASLGLQSLRIQANWEISHSIWIHGFLENFKHLVTLAPNPLLERHGLGQQLPPYSRAHGPPRSCAKKMFLGACVILSNNGKTKRRLRI